LNSSRPAFLGIDLGSSGISAVVHDGRSWRPVPDPLGDLPIPVAVYPDGAGGLLVGAAAQDQIQADPEASELDVKRRLTADGDVPIGDRRHLRTDLLTRVLRLVREQAPPDLAGVALVAPAGFDEYALKALAGCAADAGLDGELIGEQVAAVLDAEDGGLPRSGRVLVCDLGAGNPGVTEVRLQDGDHRAGRPTRLDVGGDTLDRLMRDWIRERAPEAGAGLPERLMTAVCRRLKHTLSVAPAVSVPRHLTTGRVVLTAGEWDERVRPLLASALRVCRDLAGGDDIPLVVVGGGARLRSLRALWHGELVIPDEPALAHARGAARWLASERAESSKRRPWHQPSGGSPFHSRQAAR
jgi:molecular chaperone DnaK (HSP70)